jgi:hypothetical protein
VTVPPPRDATLWGSSGLQQPRHGGQRGRDDEVMSENNVKELVRRKSPQLPAQLPDPNIFRSMNDLVQVVFAELYSESQEFRDLLQAVWPEEAVEGNLLLDDGDAAGMMRVKARESTDAEVREKVGKVNKATLIHNLRVVMRRYKLGRLQRRYLLEGEEVAASPEDEQL